MKPTNQISDFEMGNTGHILEPYFAVDGNTDAIRKGCANTGKKLGEHWWFVDLEEQYSIRYVRVYNRDGYYNTITVI